MSDYGGSTIKYDIFSSMFPITILYTPHGYNGSVRVIGNVDSEYNIVSNM